MKMKSFFVSLAVTGLALIASVANAQGVNAFQNAGWTEYPLVTGNYTSIAYIDNYAPLVGKATGGIDKLIDPGTGWQAVSFFSCEKVNALTAAGGWLWCASDQGVFATEGSIRVDIVSGLYNSIAYNAVDTNVYGARKDGGIDRFINGAGGWSTYKIVQSGVYNSIAFDQNGYVWSALATGGVKAFSYYDGSEAVSIATGNYTAIARNKTSGWMLGANANGGVDQFIAGATWFATPVVPANPNYHYIGLAGLSNDWFVGATAPNAVPEPSSIISMFAGIAGLGGFIIRRRK